MIIKFLKSNAYYIGSFIAGLIVGYLLGKLEIHFGILDGIIDNILSFFSDFQPERAFLSDIAAFEAVLIGVSLPISLQVVTWTVDRYRDHELAKFFIKERLYKLQFFLMLFNILLVIVLRFKDVSYLPILWFAVIWLIGNVVSFYFFIRLVEKYVTSTDKILVKKLRDQVEDIFKK